MLNMIAADMEGTHIREDAFLLEQQPENGVALRLRVASILPPSKAVDRDNFLRNLLSLREEETSYYYPRDDISENLGLLEKFPKKVLMAVYDMQTDGMFAEKLEIGEAVALPMTFSELQARKGFHTLKEQVEQFIAQEAHVEYIYKRSAELNVGEKGSFARSLVAGMSGLFNTTCSYYAQSKRIRTIKKMEVHLSNKVHKGTAFFNAPIRRAEGLINLERLISFIEKRDPFYTEQRLKQYGVSF